jgi:UDP-N-acetylmuramoyl-tripeptide--D-alanyl-D-alanine ligase
MQEIPLRKFFNQIELICPHDLITRGVCVDTRKLNPGDLYFALPGERVDGHAFIGNAAKAGAVAAVVSNAFNGDSHSLPLIRVENVLECLQNLASTTLLRRGSRVVAVTGSHGKTTTKDFLTTLLKQRYTVSSTPGNYNGQIGVPLSIFSAGEAEEIFVLEMGMSQKGEIAKLVQIAPPEVAVIGNVDRAHAEFFNSLEEISMAKAEILSNPQTKSAVLNRDLQFFQEIEKLGVSQKHSFSMNNKKADYYLTKDDFAVKIFAQGETLFNAEVPVPGDFNLENFLAAAIAANKMGLSWGEMEIAAKNLSLPDRRFQEIQKGDALFIDDAYNASSPLAMRAAIGSLPKPKNGGRKIAVLGEMLELGQFSEKAHREVGEFSLDKLDFLLCFGENCQTIVDIWNKKGKKAKLYTNHKEIVAALRKLLLPGDVVLVKGSRSCSMEKIIAAFN